MKQRSRGRNNNGGGKKHLPPRNQTYDSNGPDIRIRGNAHQVLEKYLTLARDATLQGDRIAAENYYQHAEHYFRVISSQNQANGRPNDRPVPTPADDQLQLVGDMEGEDGEGHGEEGSDETASHDNGQDQGEVYQQQAAPEVVGVEAEPRRARSEQPAEEAAPAPAQERPRRRREPRAPRPAAEQTEPAEV